MRRVKVHYLHRESGCRAFQRHCESIIPKDAPSKPCSEGRPPGSRFAENDQSMDLQISCQQVARNVSLENYFLLLLAENEFDNRSRAAQCRARGAPHGAGANLVRPVQPAAIE